MPLLRPVLFVSEATARHLGVECKGSLFEQIFAIARNVQELSIRETCVTLLKVRVQHRILPSRRNVR
jgi:hypothetical protein